MAAHRAAADVRVTLEVLEAQLDRYLDLPDEPIELYRLLAPVEIAGRFRREPAGRTTFALAKHAGRLLSDVASNNPSHLVNRPLLTDASGLIEAAQFSRPTPEFRARIQMASRVLLDEIHVEVFVPRALTGRDLAAVHRALKARSFLPALRRALWPVFAAHPALAAVRIRLAR